MCEDAPCCGCCGPAVWAAEARASEEWANDPDSYYDRYDDYADEEDDDEWDDEDFYDDNEAYQKEKDRTCDKTCEELGEIACGTDQCVCGYEASDEDIEQANDGSDW